MQDRENKSNHGEELPLDNYDQLKEEDILDRIPKLSKEQLLRLKEYETGHLNRQRILDALDIELKGPLDGYYELTVDEVLGKIEGYCKKDLKRILDFEEHHRTRERLIKAIHQRLEHSVC